MSRQTFDTIDVVRLEVEEALAAGELRNLLGNPTGALGGWGWVTPLAGSLVEGYAIGTFGHRLRFSAGAGAAYFLSEAAPIAAGSYAAARLKVTGSGTGAAGAPAITTRARLVFTDAAGAVVSSGPQSLATAPGAVAQVSALLAPAGAAYVALRLDVYEAGVNPTADVSLELTDAVLTTAATSAGLGSVRVNLVPNPSLEGTDVLTYLDKYDDADEGYASTLSRVSAAGAPYAGAQAIRVGAVSWVTSSSVGFSYPKVATDAVHRIPVEGGRTYALSYRVKSVSVSRPASVRVSWHDADGAVIGGTYYGPRPTVATVVGAHVTVSDVQTAPTGAAYLRIVPVIDNVTGGDAEAHWIDALMVERADAAGSYFDGATPDAGGVDYAWQGTANASRSTATEVGSLAYIPPRRFLSIVGRAVRVDLDRAPLDVGELVAELRDANLDPASSDVIRPGRQCVLSTLTPAGTWEPLITATVVNGRATYDLRQADADRRARITLTATDATSVLASTPRPDGVATIAELPAVLEGAGVPWSVNGSGDQVPTAVVVVRNDSASAVDQLAATRDSTLGSVWVDRRGIVQAWDADQLPADPVLELTAADYTDLVLDYDTDRCVNVVRIRFLRLDPATGTTEEVLHGPYVDAESVAEWGPHERTFAVQWADDDPAAIQAHAEAILAANATPAVRVLSLTAPIRDADQLGDLALLEPVDLVRITNADTGLDQTLRVETVGHRIRAERWTLELGFAAPDSVAAPRTVPSPTTTGVATLAELLRPVGEVTMFYGLPSAIPAGWLPLDGRSTAGYPELIAYLGGATNVPDFRDRLPIGAGGTRALGNTGGASTATLVEANLPPHKHGMGHNHDVPRKSGVGTAGGYARGNGGNEPNDTTGGVNGDALTATGPGSSTPFSIMPPTHALYFVIRAVAGVPA